jgi:epoxyqueuosine reductase QueG
MHGEKASASFFAPWDRNVEPYIRIASGDYRKLKVKRGRDHALAAYICSLAHEVVHYQQWVATGSVSERNVARKARSILQQYAKTVDRP